jgi:Uma2 family endonuclease
MSLFEIEVPETKPETEWVRGRPLQKMSPTYDQAVLQRLFTKALADWAEAGEYGRVAPGWRFRVAPPDDIVRPLVPDVAYLSYDALPEDAPREALQVPLGTPTVAVEIVSPEDRRLDINDKIDTYLEAGAEAVIVIDVKSETIEVHDGITSVLAAGDTLTHCALPGFSLDVGALFAQIRK